MPGNDVMFVEITNGDIYKKLCEIEAHVIETNGKVKINRLVAKAALCLSILALSIVTGINLIGSGLI